MLATALITKAILMLAALLGRIALVILAVLAVVVPAYLAVVGGARLQRVLGGPSHGTPAPAPVCGT